MDIIYPRVSTNRLSNNRALICNVTALNEGLIEAGKRSESIEDFERSTYGFTGFVVSSITIRPSKEIVTLRNVLCNQSNQKLRFSLL